MLSRTFRDLPNGCTPFCAPGASPGLSYTREIWLILRDVPRRFSIPAAHASPAHTRVRAGAHAGATRWVERGAAGEFPWCAGGERFGRVGGGAGGDEPRECVAVARARRRGKFCGGVGGGAGAWCRACAGDCSTTEDHARRVAAAGFGRCAARGDARGAARLDDAESRQFRASALAWRARPVGAERLLGGAGDAAQKPRRASTVSGEAARKISRRTGAVCSGSWRSAWPGRRCGWCAARGNPRGFCAGSWPARRCSRRRRAFSPALRGYRPR